MGPIARVYIVRHGETEENRLRVVQGQLDTALNAHGEVQARKVAEALRGVRFDLAYSSDLQRARRTAEVILEQHPGVELQTTKALRERGMGDLQGKPLEQRSTLNPTIEGSVAFTARGLTWWKNVIIQGATSTGTVDIPTTVLVVSHGGMIGTIVRGLVTSGKVKCAAGVKIGKCLNVSVSIVEIDSRNGQGRLVAYGDVSHLTRSPSSTLRTMVEENVDECVT